MASSLSPRIAILAKPSIKLVHYAGDADTRLIPTLQLPLDPRNNNRPVLEKTSSHPHLPSWQPMGGQSGVGEQ